jgi:hypothetical protein
MSLGGDPLVVSAAGPNGFIVKYDAATGSHIWSKSIGGSSDVAYDLVVTDQVWLAVGFSGTVQVGNANYTSAGISDVAFGSLGLATGAIGASGAFGGPSVDAVTGIVASSTALCFGGWFGMDGAAASATTVLGNALAGAGMTDVFIGCKAP